jgi:dephospho-CoA kinase
VIVVGLTGGIASGKSTVARLLAERGAHVIDADLLGHRAYEPGADAFRSVVDAFGEDIVASDGTIDRGALGQKVFGKPEELDRLTGIVWPAIRAMAAQEIEAVRSSDAAKVVVLEAAVLFEAGWQDLVDEVWVTAVDRATAVARAVARSGLAPEQVEARIDAQLTNDERKGQAQVVIENEGDEGMLVERVAALWSGLTSRASV